MGYYADDGNELDPTTIPIPGMCLLCEKKDDPNEEILCNLNRWTSGTIVTSSVAGS